MKIDSSNSSDKNSSTTDNDQSELIATKNDSKIEKSSNIANDEISANSNQSENKKLKINTKDKVKQNEWEDYHEKLLKVLKKEVKQIMEEAVTKKYVHEESSSIISLCAAIDACLSHGLRRRALGLFKTNSTTALLQKSAKNCESAAKIYKIVTELEKIMPKGSSSNDSLNNYKFRLSLTKQTNPTNSVNNNLSNFSNTNGSISSGTTRYLWIRIALFEKKLYDIIEHLVSNYSIYYEKEALVSDPVCGQLLADLLIGPCTLDYSKMKCQDHIFIDPPAEELITRHNLINSPANSCSSSPLTKTSNNSLRNKPLYLPYYKWFNFVSSSSGSNETNSSSTQSVENHNDDLNNNSPVHTSLTQRLSLNSPFSPKEYVESLHQNYKTTLLYGKNNVYVQPNDNIEALPGYLSLHQSSNSLEIRWTPNELMSKGKKTDKDGNQEDSSVFWDYALNIFVEDTVYLHCHHNDEGGLAVFIAGDGTTKPSIRFPKGSHLLQFLTCLESGLLPTGQLDPPLSIQKGKGKVFPLIKRKSKGKNKLKNGDKNSNENDEKSNEELTNDYVFRIVMNSLKPETISEEMFNPKSTISQDTPTSKQVNCLWKPKAGFGNRQKLISISSNSSTNSSKSLNEDFHSLSTSTTSSSSIQTVCETMKHQIISRAFRGWLAYVRHLKTVRTHLSQLVNNEIINSDDQLKKGLTQEQWLNLQDEEGRIKDKDQLLKLVYFGCCESSIRSKVWPYLLGHYDFELTKKQREQQDEEMRQNYELLMTEWSSVEAIVKIRDRENLTASLAKFNSEERTNSLSHDQLDDVFQEPNDSDSKSTKTKEQSNFLIEKLLKDENYSSQLKDVIEEDENCAECKFEEEDDGEEDDDINNKTEKTESRSSSALKLNNLKRQRNVYTQSSQQSTVLCTTNQILITDASVDLCRNTSPESTSNNQTEEKNDATQYLGRQNVDSRNDGQLSADHSTCVSPASSNGGVYPNELLDSFSLNMHRIEKDVNRCDRQLPFFMNTKNLDKLRNIICTYVWKNLSNGYVQGFCDLVAPLLVILEDEMLTYSCFCELMKRMSSNFPYTSATNAIDSMDLHFANMRSLIHILDPDLFELMHSNGDYTHFYFCYRWFLLDFKREFNYDDVYKVWEVIWSGKTIASSNMVLFIALSLVQQYREIILDNSMDFTDIIKFFKK